MVQNMGRVPIATKIRIHILVSGNLGRKKVKELTFMLVLG